MSWYTLVFLAVSFAAVTLAAIMTHIPRIPEQRGLLAVIVSSALAAVWSMLVTQVADPARGIEVSRAIFVILAVLLAFAVLAGFLDLFYYGQARQRRLAGAGWSLIVGLALIGCGGFGLLSHFNIIG